MTKAEKFIEEQTKDCSNVSLHIGKYYEWITPRQAKYAVEIAREEMINKACGYLDGLIELLNKHGHGLKKERIISGFKQAMKGK